MGSFLLLVAVVCLGLNGRWLLAQGYARYASEYLRYGANGKQGLVAADLATRLTPYASRSHVLRAGIFERERRYEESLEALRSALTYGANNPFIWQVYIRLKLRRNQFDGELAEAMQQVVQLAPTSFWLHSENARLGLQYWEWGKPEHRHFWSASTHFVLKTHSKALRQTVLNIRKEELFCSEYGGHSHGVRAWCRRALTSRQKCFTAPPRRPPGGWCKYVGFVQDPLK